MSKNLEVSFYVPKQILRGLENGSYERIGGIIRNNNTKEIVYWLREGGQSVKNAESLILKLTELGKATLAFTDFLYMNDNFKSIKKKLDDIGLKIDSQNISKIESGFVLAKEAEIIDDYDSLKTQMIHARSLLEEGSNIFRNIYDQQKEEDEQKSFTSYHALRMVVLSQIGIIRSYAHLGEYNIAVLRNQRLKTYLLDCALWYCRRRCNEDISWWQWILIAPFIIPTMVASIFTDIETDEQKIVNMIDKSKENNESIQNTLDNVFKKMKKVKVAIPSEVKDLIEYSKYLDGYDLELEAYKQRSVKFKEMCGEISSKGTMSLK